MIELDDMNCIPPDPKIFLTKYYRFFGSSLDMLEFGILINMLCILGFTDSLQINNHTPILYSIFE